MDTSRERAKSLSCWSGPVDPQPLKGGLSNESFTVVDGGETYVVRFGTDVPVHHVFRDNEVMASHAAFEAGFAPELVHAGEGVTVFRFISGKTFDEADVRANIERVAALVHNFHNEMPHHVSGPGRFFWPFHMVRDYARTLKAGNSRMVGEIPGFLTLADELEAVQPAMPIIYSHDDLLPANFIDDGERLWLIDFEYAAFSTPMFDLAGVSSNAQFGEDEDKRLLRSYFGNAPNQALQRGFGAMKCASLLREAMWSMVSELHLDAPGVDYVAYTDENLERLDQAVAAYKARF